MCRARINSPTGKSPCVALLEQVIIVRVDKCLPSGCIILLAFTGHFEWCFCKAKYTISDYMFGFYDLYIFCSKDKDANKKITKTKIK